MTYELADALYRRGWDDRDLGRDYDPRKTEQWQAVVDELGSPAAAVEALMALHDKAAADQAYVMLGIESGHDWKTADKDAKASRKALQTAITKALRSKHAGKN
jgi:hypothetical protein